MRRYCAIIGVSWASFDMRVARLGERASRVEGKFALEPDEVVIKMREAQATGKSPEPAGWKACATSDFPVPSLNSGPGELLIGSLHDNLADLLVDGLSRSSTTGPRNL